MLIIKARNPFFVRFVRFVVSLAFLLGANGCVSREYAAWRTAEQMTNIATSPRDELRFRSSLMEQTPESEAYLAEAFFPIGLYDVPTEAIGDVAAAGFNLIVNSDTTEQYIARASAAGMRLIPYIRQNKMPEDVLDAADKREIFAWYLMDEPDLNGMPPAEYRELLDRLRHQEMRRPIFLTVLRPENYAAYLGDVEILAPNPYPIRAMEPVRNDLREVVRAVRLARAAAASRSVWAILQAFWAEPVWPRNPTPEELRAVTWMALNNGASGIIYFSYRSGDRTLPEHEELWAEITRLNGQIRALRGALLTPVQPGLKMEMLADNPPRNAILARPPERYFPLDASLRKFRGAWLLILVNPDSWAKKSRVMLPRAAQIGEAHELFTEPGLAVTFPSDQPMEMSFEPYQTRMFWIGGE